MKINKLKNYTKLGIILFSISLLLTNCQNDIDDRNEIQNTKTKFITETLNYNQINNIDKITSKISFFKDRKKYINSLKRHDKNFNSDEFDFSVNTDKVIYIEDLQTGYHSYNFYISRNNPQDEYLENLILSQNNSNGYDTYIIKYDFTLEDLYNNNTEAIENATNIITKINFDTSPLKTFAIIEIDGKLYRCNVTSYSENGFTHFNYTNCVEFGGSSSSGSNGGQNNGDEVSGDNNNSDNSNDNNDEDHDATPSYTPEENSDTQNNNYSGGSTNNSSNEKQITTTPIAPTYQEQVEECLNSPSTQSGNSNFDFQNWLDNAEHFQKKRIATFLNDNDCSQEAQYFVIDAMEAIENGGEVDFEERIILDPNFTNSITKCIHDKMKSNTTNIYSKMLNHFNSSTQKNITFSINNSIGSDWGITSGNPQVLNNYNIIINQNIIETNGSNLMRYISLSHELIHAFMFDALEDAGVITFDLAGYPVLNVNCPANNINLNTLSIKDRFESLICAMNSSGTLTQDWTHDLFNSDIFNIQDYRQELESLILNDYDWNSESSIFTDNANTTFGSNWKQEIAQAVSWIGLENTIEYSTYLNNYSTQPLKFLFISDIRNKISNTNNNCP